MKRSAKISAAVIGTSLLMLSSVSFTASAEAVTSGDYSYELQGADVTIVKYTGEDEEIFIPASLDGNKVTAIGSQAFQMNPDVVSIEVPDGVTKIGDHAFAIDIGLETITLPATVTEIGEKAFEQCTKLKTVNFAGDESAWGAVTIADGNDTLTAITPAYNAALTPQSDDAGAESEASSSEAASSEDASSEEASSEAVSSEEASSAAETSSAVSETTSSAAAASSIMPPVCSSRITARETFSAGISKEKESCPSL